MHGSRGTGGGSVRGRDNGGGWRDGGIAAGGRRRRRRTLKCEGDAVGSSAGLFGTGPPSFHLTGCLCVLQQHPQNLIGCAHLLVGGGQSTFLDSGKSPS